MFANVLILYNSMQAFLNAKITEALDIISIKYPSSTIKKLLNTSCEGNESLRLFYYPFTLTIPFYKT